jgi:hypothetical protein
VDDQDDRGYSRAPELEDLVSLCKALNGEGVRYDRRDVAGVLIPIADKELLIRTKNTVRPSDAADVRFLRLRISEDEKNSRG